MFVRAHVRVLPTFTLVGFDELREPDSGHYSRVKGQLDSRYQLQLMFVRISSLFVRFNSVLGPALQFL